MKTLTHISLVFLCCCLSGQVLLAQSANMTISLHYDDEPLGMVLTDLSKRYALRFSYSTNFVPVNKQVNVHADRISLKKGLDLLFENTKIVYAHIGGQYVLKIDPNKPERLSQLKTEPLPRKIVHTTSIRQQHKQDMPKSRPVFHQLPELKRIVIRKVPGHGDRAFAIDRNLLTLIPLEEYKREFEETRIAQVSLMPFVGTNLGRSKTVTNNVSLNVLWGSNGGVDGMEVGGFVNTIKKDVRGVQVAGLGNTVGGKVVGTQVSGLFNVGKGRIQGVQISGLFNTAGAGNALQAAGLFNVANGDFSGIQLSGLFNVSEGQASGLQLSGLFNTSGGKVKTQLSGIFNVAGDVDYGQVSSLINVGKKVDGFQIALINVADTISGVPLGLLNIIRKGYNRFEMGASEYMYANIGGKFGAHAFYNIVNMGVSWEDRKRILNSAEFETITQLSWSIGYGIGTAIPMGSYWLVNMELITSHVNEREMWTNELNQLNQFRLLFSVRTGRSAAFYAGPTANLLVSKLYDSDTGEYGSQLMPYTSYEKVNNNTSLKGWIGFNAGVRF